MMIKRYLFVLSIIISVSSFSQSRNIQNAYNAFRQEKFEEAKKFIDLAYNHESTSNEPKMWNYRSKIYLEISLNHSELDVDAVFKATEAYIKCLENDSKGRNIVRKWTRKEDVIDGLVKCGYKLFNSGVEDYNNGNYERALSKYNKVFEIIPLDETDLLKRGNIVPETIYMNSYLAVFRMKDIDLQIEYLQKLISIDVNNPDVYINLSNIYKEKGDLDQALKYIEDGKIRFDSEIKLINSEIDLYLKMGKSTSEIIEKLSNAILYDDLNEVLYIIRSQMYLQEGMIDSAESDLLSALEIDPQSLSANNNLASLYLTMTEPLVEKLNSITNYRSKKIKVYESQIEDLHRKALPYIEKSSELDPENIPLLNILAEIYYKLGMEEKSSKIRERISQK